jgi:hypothetical protein
MDIAEYMKRKCICGAPRDEHVHFEDQSGQLHVLAINNRNCSGFLDEIELQLGGNPQTNPLLAPLIDTTQEREITIAEAAAGPSDSIKGRDPSN